MASSKHGPSGQVLGNLILCPLWTGYFIPSRGENDVYYVSRMTSMDMTIWVVQYLGKCLYQENILTKLFFFVLYKVKPDLFIHLPVKEAGVRKLEQAI